MKGSLEPVNPKYVTPKKTMPGESSPDYTPASPVDVSPIKDVDAAAKAQSMQEDYEKKIAQASRGKGRTRKLRKTRKSKKSVKKSRKGRK
jgi:hypothetical protein